MDSVQWMLTCMIVWWLLGNIGTYRALRRRYSSLEEALTHEPIGFIVIWFVYPLCLGPLTLLLDRWVWHRGPR